jgi:hypothetical protein
LRALAVGFNERTFWVCAEVEHTVSAMGIIEPISAGATEMDWIATTAVEPEPGRAQNSGWQRL